MEIYVKFQSPQWGSNSKAEDEKAVIEEIGFSPRNGEVILKKYRYY